MEKYIDKFFNENKGFLTAIESDNYIINLINKNQCVD